MTRDIRVLTRHAQAIVALRRAKELEAGARASQRADAAGRLIAENAAAKGASLAAADTELENAAEEASPEELTVELEDGAPSDTNTGGASQALKSGDERSASPPAVGVQTTPSARAPAAPPALKHASSEDAALAETLSGLIKEQKQAALAHMRAGDMRAAKAALERAKELGDEFAQVHFRRRAPARRPLSDCVLPNTARRSTRGRGDRC